VEVGCPSLQAVLTLHGMGLGQIHINPDNPLSLEDCSPDGQLATPPPIIPSVQYKHLNQEHTAVHAPGHLTSTQGHRVRAYGNMRT